jgi:hypothetical protein
MIKLPRLPIGWQDQPGLFERYWDESQTIIEQTFEAILTIPAIEDALATLDNTISDAEDAIAATNAAALEIKSKDSLANSYPTGFTGSLLTADSTGTVVVALHQRTYNDSVLNPPVVVNGSSISTGAVPGETVRIYYNDSTRSGGAVTYYATIDPASPLAQQGDVHSVGAVVIPAVGSNDGNNLGPPGYVYQ